MYMVSSFDVSVMQKQDDLELRIMTCVTECYKHGMDSYVNKQPATFSAQTTIEISERVYNCLMAVHRYCHEPIFADVKLESYEKEGYLEKKTEIHHEKYVDSIDFKIEQAEYFLDSGWKKWPSLSM